MIYVTVGTYQKKKYCVLRYKHYLKFRSQNTNLKLLKHILLFHDIAAIVTFQLQRLFTINIKLGPHRLIAVTYTSRISTLHDALNDLRQFYLLLLYNLVATNNVDRCVRSK